MRKRFTRACYAVSAAAAVATSLSFGAASAATHAPKDTPACSFFCISFFNKQLGSNTDLNAFVPGDTGVGGRVGQKVNLHLAGNFRPNGDWQFSFPPTAVVFQFCGLLANDFFSPTSYICTHFPLAPILELEWAPFGNQSGLCAGVAKAGIAGESVTLQDCGVNANTVWVGDVFHSSPFGPTCFLQSSNPTLPGGAGGRFCPWINGGDTSFSHPLVMTLNTGTQNPTNQLMIARENLVGPVARGNQLFGWFRDPFGGI